MSAPSREIFEAMDREQLQAALADVQRRCVLARHDEIRELLIEQGRIELVLLTKPIKQDPVAVLEADVERFVANRIKTARGLVGFSQGRLALAAGLSDTQVSRIESRSRKVTVAELIRIAIAVWQPLTFFTYPNHPDVVTTGWEAVAAR